MKALITIIFCLLASHIAVASEIGVDQDFVVTKREPPKSFSSKESAYCCVTYDVSPKGRAINIKTPYCTNTKFSKKAAKSLKSWRFDPALKDGSPVLQSGGETTIVSIASKPSGHPIPGRDGFLEPRDNAAITPAAPSDFRDLFMWQREYFNSDNVCPITAP